MHVRSVLLACALALTSAPARAAPFSPPDPATPSASDRAVFEACLADAEDDDTPARACIARVADACIAKDGGETTAGMIACDAREQTLWSARIDADRAALMARHSPAQHRALATAQAAFERWRAEKCAYAASVYEGGSLARVVASRCRLETTAEWSIELGERRRDEETP